MDALSTVEYDEVAAQVLSSDYRTIRQEFHNLNYHASGSELAEMSDPLSVAIADRRDSVDIVMGEGDLVAVRYRILGKHKGNLYGIPATDTNIDIYAAAIFKLANDKIIEGWFMADEAGLLRQLGKPLPARADGRIEAGPVSVATVTGDAHIANLLANPVDSREYRNKLMVNAYKSKNRPDSLLPPSGRYGESFRRGFAHLTDIASDKARTDYPFGGAFPDRVDMIGNMIADGKRVLIQFKLTATNTGSLFGMPPSNNPINAWELGFMEFDGDDWKYAWFFGDDLGMLMQMEGPQDIWFTGIGE
jgi:predicted ester cyclase